MSKNVFKGGISREYMSKETILKYVTEADIFELVFDYKPEEFDYVTSPFREDLNPDCWFENSGPNGSLRFKDFADSRTIRGVKMRNISCFDAVMIFYSLSFTDTIKFIVSKLIYGNELEPKKGLITQSKTSIKKETEIVIEARQFILSDKKFWWDRYSISKFNLIEDKVFPVSKYRVITSDKDYTNRVKSNTYCFTDFKDGKKKIYSPFMKDKGKFITNCNENDIGGYDKLPKEYKKLVITKSYKDYRVLKNQGLTVLWLQNEGMFPSLELLLPLCYKAEQVIIFFDNDDTGINAAKALEDIINSYIENRARTVTVPLHLFEKGITDPADFIEIFKRDELIRFLSLKSIL